MTPAVPDPTVEALSERERGWIQIEVAALRAGHVHMRDVFAVVERILAARAAAPDALRVRVEALADELRTKNGSHWCEWGCDVTIGNRLRALLEETQ